MSPASPFRRALLAATVAALPLAATAQGSFPTKPIKIIVGFPAGGPLDAHARLLADRLQQLLGQPVIVDYKAGAGGTVGADFVAKSDPDGYTLLLANTGTMVINPALYRKLPYDALKDFVPLALGGRTPNIITVNPATPARDLKELVELARKQPLAYASSGIGTTTHLSIERLKTAAKVDITHVPYRGAGPAMQDLLAGREGIIGALTEDLIDTSLESAADIARLRHTPGGASACVVRA